jgi:hypothetical protein
MTRIPARTLLVSALLLLALPVRAQQTPWSPDIDKGRALGLAARLTGANPDAIPAPLALQPLAPASDAPLGTLSATTWEAVPPPALWVHSTIYDPLRDRLVVFGGRSYAGGSNEVWTFALSGIPRWQKLTPSGTPPSARAFHSAIFDTLRDRMIVFGGADDANVAKNEVWSLSFAGNPTWTKLTPGGTAPLARQWHAVAYDRARDRMLVSGGLVAGAAASEVWALALAGATTWTKLNPAAGGPGNRYAHAAVYDAANDRLVVFGGIDGAGAAKNDAWALSLGATPAWTLIAATGTPPSTRFGAGALYDRARQRMVLFGGGTGVPNQNDTWTLSLGLTPAWTKLVPTGPPQGRQFHTVSYDPIGDRLLAFGGSSGPILSDTWALALDAPVAWVPLSGTRRKGHSGVFDSARSRMVVFGGENGVTLNDAWELSLGVLPTWSRLAPTGTTPTRTLHGAIYETRRDRMIVFGGRGTTTPVNDTWELTFSGELAWHPVLPVGTPPSPREDVAVIYDEPRGRMIVFGGADLGGVYNDVWALSLMGTPTWTKLLPTGTAPTARAGAQIVYDPARDRIVVYGGFNNQFLPVGDVFALTLSGTPNWTKLLPTGGPPAPRVAGAVVFDSGRDRMVLSGGTDFDVFFGDTWSLTFNGASTATWTQLSTPGTAPTPRSDHRAVYDFASDRMLFFGGQNLAGILHETWALDFTGPVAVPDLLLPSRMEFAGARPNPARAGLGTTLSFALPRASSAAELSLFDLAGRRVATLVKGPLAAGPQAVRWDGNGDAGQEARAGVYFARLVTEEGVATSKVVVTR